ncbi:MAG: APC family permease [Bryobacteraceae bacterium]
MQNGDHGLKRELGLWDLVFTQILFIIGLGWVGAAAKLGSSHVTFWLLAVALFYIPSAIVVIHLSRRMPFEGGLYEWARLGFNERAGFLVGWNLWLYAMVLMSEVGVQGATNLAYATGVTSIAENKWSIALASLIILGGLTVLSTIGLGAGKWLHGAGGITLVAILSAMIVLPVVAWARGVKPVTKPFDLSVPAFTLMNLNILGKMGFAALGGFEYVAIFAGESRDPARIVGRSVLIAAPVIALLFILGTGSVLFFVPMNSIDLVSPVPQVLAIAAKPFAAAAQIAGAVIMALLGIRIAQASINFSATARLPMVAGWDHLLPRWFTKLHPAHRTPVNSILFVGAATLTCSLVGMTGVARQEAYQLFNNASGIFYALTYLAMFALPFALKDVSIGVRIASASGFVMTLLYVALSIFPIVEVGSRALFTAKICGVILAGNLIGIAIFEMARQKVIRSAKLA